jgi:hypothetical protein
MHAFFMLLNYRKPVKKGSGFDPYHYVQYRQRIPASTRLIFWEDDALLGQD